MKLGSVMSVPKGVAVGSPGTNDLGGGVGVSGSGTLSVLLLKLGVAGTCTALLQAITAARRIANKIAAGLMDQF
jgi:hypothetical protein